MSTQVSLSESSLMLTFYSFKFLKALISINSDYLYQISQIQMQFISGTSSSSHKNASFFALI